MKQGHLAPPFLSNFLIGKPPAGLAAGMFGIVVRGGFRASLQFYRTRDFGKETRNKMP
jgi:hypothetical protein